MRGGREREKEFGPELEMSAILCWISSFCPCRSPYSWKDIDGSLAFQFLLVFTLLRSLAGDWKEKSEVRVFAPLVPPIRSHLELAAPSSEGHGPSKGGQLKLSFKDPVTSASPHPFVSRNGKAKVTALSLMMPSKPTLL